MEDKLFLIQCIQDSRPEYRERYGDARSIRLLYNQTAGVAADITPRSDGEGAIDLVLLNANLLLTDAEKEQPEGVNLHYVNLRNIKCSELIGEQYAGLPKIITELKERQRALMRAQADIGKLVGFAHDTLISNGILPISSYVSETFTVVPSSQFLT